MFLRGRKLRMKRVCHSKTADFGHTVQLGSLLSTLPHWPRSGGQSHPHCRCARATRPAPSLSRPLSDGVRRALPYTRAPG